MFIRLPCHLSGMRLAKWDFSFVFLSRVGPGGKPQSILKKKSKYGNVTDSDSERRGKVRVRISDKSKRPLLNLEGDASE